MPRRSPLSGSDRATLLALPSEEADRIRVHSFSETDLALVRQRRGDANRFGFAVQLCLLRYPGVALAADRAVDDALLRWVARALWIDIEAWSGYAARDETRNEHRRELLAYLGMEAFGLSSFRNLVRELVDVALQSDKGLLLGAHALESLRRRRIVVPRLDVIDRACARGIARANRTLHRRLTAGLTDDHRVRLDALLERRDGEPASWLNWLRRSPTAASSGVMLEHLERLEHYRRLKLPAALGTDVHQNRLLRIAREGAQMRPADLADFERERRHATLAAIALEGRATVTDEVIDLHDRIMIRLFATALNKHRARFEDQGRAINDKVRLYASVGRALVDAREAGRDAYAAIESVIAWDSFVESITAADELARPGTFDHLPLVTDQFPTLRRYTPRFLDALRFEAAPAARAVLAAIDTLRRMNEAGARTVPKDAPTGFVRTRWKPVVFTDRGIDRRGYEICVLSELKNALRSGDIWVEGSRQFRNFDDYLIPKAAFDGLAANETLPLAIDVDADRYLEARLALLHDELATVNELAGDDALPDAAFGDTGLKVTPLDRSVPDAAQHLIDRVSRLMPRIKITELLSDVDDWTGFTDHFVHLKTDEPAKDRTLLLSAVLADGINLGLTRMADSSPGATYDRLSWLQAWHVRDETYTAALAALVNAQLANSFAAHWGDGTTSSSDGQRFQTGDRGQGAGQINPRYGSAPGRLVYTHVSDQYAPFSTRLINVGVRDSTYVLDGLLYHESDLRIEEHYTDTAGFTDHVFAPMHLLGFRFAPRIRDLKDTKLYVGRDAATYPELSAMIGGSIQVDRIRDHWDEILRLATSIRTGSVTSGSP